MCRLLRVLWYELLAAAPLVVVFDSSHRAFIQLFVSKESQIVLKYHGLVLIVLISLFGVFI
jgi:hypothetical protein